MCQCASVQCNHLPTALVATPSYHAASNTFQAPSYFHLPCSASTTDITGPLDCFDSQYGPSTLDGHIEIAGVTRLGLLKHYLHIISAFRCDLNQRRSLFEILETSSTTDSDPLIGRDHQKLPYRSRHPSLLIAHRASLRAHAL